MFRFLGFFALLVFASSGAAWGQTAPSGATIFRDTLTSQSNTVSLGVSVTLIAYAPGSSPFNYQWNKNGTPVAGATGSTYPIAAAAYSDDADYTVTVSNGAGSVTSAPFHLVVKRPAPTITQQPVGGTIAAGGSITLTVAVSGYDNYLFSWFRNNALVKVDNQPSLVISDATASSAGNYIVKVSGSSVSTDEAVSQVAVVAVTIPPPVITRQPVGAAVPVNGSVIVAVEATGSNLRYSWSKDGVGVGAIGLYQTSSILAIGVMREEYAGTYTVTVSSQGGGSVDSVPVVLTATPGVVIKTQPVSGNVAVGGTTTLTVVAELAPGVPAGLGISYWWTKDGVVIPGARSSSYTISSATSADAGGYAVRINSSWYTTTTNTAVLSVGDMPPTSPTPPAPTAPAITAQPLSRSVVAGASVSFEVTASGTGPLSYQWFKDGSAVSGANSSTLSLANVQLANAGSYSVAVTGAGGTVTSSAASLTVSAAPETPTDPSPPVSPDTPGQAIAPSISRPPTSATVELGAGATFFVSASGTPPLSYQWLKDGTPIPGATEQTLDLGATTMASAGVYRVTISNEAGSVTSADAFLTINEVSVAGSYSAELERGGRVGLIVDSSRQINVLGFLPDSRTGFVLKGPAVGADGSFGGTATLLAPTSAMGGDAGAGGGRIEPKIGHETAAVSGKIANGMVTVSVPALSIGTVGSRSSGSSTAAGFYEVPAVNAASGAAYTLVGADGSAIFVAATAAGAIEGGTGIVGADGRLTVEGAGGSTVTVSVDASDGSLMAAASKGVLSGVSFAGVRADVIRTDHLANISTRALVGSGAEAMFAGFVVTGASPKPVLIRAVGPTLAGFGVSGTLADPQLTLRRGDEILATNNDWTGAEIVTATSRVGGFPLVEGTKDAVILTVLDPGSYTAQVSGAGDSTGVAIVEVYDASEGPMSAETTKLINIATRGRVGGGDQAMIAGLVVRGNAPKQVLIRAIGPTLANYGLAGALSDPELVLRQGDTTIATNDNWAGDAAIASATAARGAFALDSNSRDAALLITLAPGNYTVQVRGVGDTTGLALVEVYEVLE